MIHQFKIGYGIITDPGIKRRYKPNEDNVYAVQGVNETLQHFGLFVVADGMGGHQNGRDASQLAIDTLVGFLYPQISSFGVLDEESGKSLLVEGVKMANEAICQKNQETFEDSGTTVTVVLVVDDIAYIANVGDSRTYLWRCPDGLRQITNDHSVVASLVSAGIIKPDDIYTHPKRNQIYRSLGEKMNVEVDVFVEQLEVNDRILLCSDGLWEMVRDPQIDEILLAAPTPEIASTLLVDKAKENGGEDNVSVIVAQVYAPESSVSENSVDPVEESQVLKLPLQLVHAGHYIVWPLAAFLHVWCMLCGFLLLIALPWVISLPSKLITLLEQVVEWDETTPVVHFHLVTWGNGDIEIVYSEPIQQQKEGMEIEAVGRGWQWSLY